MWIILNWTDERFIFPITNEESGETIIFDSEDEGIKYAIEQLNHDFKVVNIGD